ncbi:hypothetical protein BJX96DRAFT_127421 [Aspergillus floccosus]
MTPASPEELLGVHGLRIGSSHSILPRCASISQVSHLSSNLIPKYYNPSEVEDALKATEVANQLAIRGPFIRKLIKNQHNAYIIMDRIEGTRSDVAWKDLSWFTTVKLGLQLRRFVKTLRSVTLPAAGSLATGECRSFWLEDCYGLPANSGPGEIAHFFFFFRFWMNFTSMRRAMQESK